MLRSDAPAFGLPGNPVSAMIAYELFCRQALLRLAGRHAVPRPRFVAVVDEKISRLRDGKVHFVQVVASLDERGQLHVRSGGAQNPHMLHAMAGPNAPAIVLDGLALVPDGDGVDEGQELQLIVIDPHQLNTVS
jgi:molybdopterin molybdotransferase